MSFKTPILFIIFNRPNVAIRVFNEIRKVKPSKLYIAADGPRLNKAGEKERCEEARNIIKQIDWDCEVKTLFRDENFGCGRAVSEAISWFFDNVEEGIILEDDCLPDESFFEYCEYLLNKYRYDEKVFMISGDNFLPESLKLKESYYFSNFPHIWGWATWKRAWSLYDFKMKDLENFIKNRKIENIIKNKATQDYFLYRFNEVSGGGIDTWDYQWVYTIWNNNAFSIAPNVNLVSNIGFGADGTHTLNEKDAKANLKTKSMIFPIIDSKLENSYDEGDAYESQSLVDKHYKLKKILKFIGVFKIIKKFYLLLK